MRPVGNQQQQQQQQQPGMLQQAFNQAFNMNPSSTATSTTQNSSGIFGGLQQQPQAFSGQQQPFGGQNQQSRMQHKGIPQVVPTNVMGGQMGGGLQQQQQQQPQGPNLMQKLNEITAPGGDILSKGKELIFMKFGLGGGK